MTVGMQQPREPFTFVLGTYLRGLMPSISSSKCPPPPGSDRLTPLDFHIQLRSQIRSPSLLSLLRRLARPDDLVGGVVPQQALQPQSVEYLIR